MSIYDDCIKKFKENGMNIRGDHGIYHWERVHRNALLICKGFGKADYDVCRMFAYLHDCCRENEFRDDNHGYRAADFMMNHLDTWKASWPLNGDQTLVLLDALKYHNDGQITEHPTLGACWDADRLDLPRVGIIPQECLMSTQIGKSLAKHWTYLNF